MRKIEAIVLLLIAAGVVVLNLGFKDWVDAQRTDSNLEIKDASQKESGDGGNVFARAVDEIAEIVKPDSVTVLMLGLDKSKVLADINIVAHLDTTTNKVKLISIPRDLFIDFREEGFKAIKADNATIGMTYCKLTEVYSYAGRGAKGRETMRRVAEAVTGLDIDYVASVDTGGFNDIIDAVGGVDFYVPQDMNYEDPYQDLYIHLEEGQQRLDGDKAEQLVRFRKYKGELPPDVQRMQVQQNFLRALTSQLLATRDLASIQELITVAYDMVKTDMDLLTILRYGEYVMGEDIGELLGTSDMLIIPSESQRIQMGEFRPWFEVWDKDEAHLAVKDLMGE